MARMFAQFVGSFSSDFENRFLKTAFNVFFLLTMFLSFCGMIFLAGDFLPEGWSWTASLIIVLNGITVLVSESRARAPLPNLLLFSLIASITLAIEYVGVTTSFPFGAYTYSDVLSFRFAGVPIAIAFAWYSTIMTTRRIAEFINGATSKLRIALTAGVLVLALDVALEPMASFINGYWIWEGNGVPLENYISWFTIGTFAVFAVCLADEIKEREPSAEVVRAGGMLFGVQLLLLIVIDIAHSYTQPAMFALLLVAAAFVSRVTFGFQAKRERLLEK